MAIVDCENDLEIITDHKLNMKVSPAAENADAILGYIYRIIVTKLWKVN